LSEELQMIDRDTLVRIYGNAIVARRLDERVQQMFIAGTLPVGWQPWLGAELLGATTAAVLQPADYLVAYYKDASTPLSRGASLERTLAEVLGKRTGLHKGKSGWVHLIDPSANVVFNSGVIGGNLPIAVGWALSSQLRGDGKVTLCTFGDGAANEGGFHEALTLAALWQLPVVYLAHNNGYAEHTSFEKTSPVPHLADRAKGYGIPGETVNGGNVPAVWDVLTRAIERARSGQGPTLVEAVIPRLRGHGRNDQMEYIPADRRPTKELDPLPPFRAWLIAQGHASQNQLADLDEQANTRIDAAFAFASNSPDPDPEVELRTDVYATSDAPIIGVKSADSSFVGMKVGVA
jgi:pyruvate dehydrogenase E1 component alpha subunit